METLHTGMGKNISFCCYAIIGSCQQVHREMGPFLNEYMYQEALDILFEENHIEKVREYYFSVTFHGRQIKHKHYIDFLVNNEVLVECKAVDCIGPEQRQQLWNYMRLTKISIGILYNFAPTRDQCERYCLDAQHTSSFATNSVRHSVKSVYLIKGLLMFFSKSGTQGFTGDLFVILVCLIHQKKYV